jgi:hypothetical protein
MHVVIGSPVPLALALAGWTRNTIVQHVRKRRSSRDGIVRRMADS